MTLCVYGGSGFVGGNFKRIYSNFVEMQRDERNPRTNEILYFISTVDNYNVHDNITLDVNTNLGVLCEVLDYCRTQDIVFNFISSWFVYGKTPYLPVTEDSVCNPTGFYSITKKCAEDLLISFCNTYGVKYRIMRLCNVLGAGDQKASKKKNAITWMIDELKLDHDVHLYDGGSNCRDVMHVQDVCAAIKLICDNGEYNQIYNIGSGKPTTIGEIIALAKNYLNSKSKINYIDPPKFHNNVQTKNFWMDTKKLKSLGFEQKLSLEFTIKDLCL
jgi:nucleoside-diphosphate-sugar epimerase